MVILPMTLGDPLTTNIYPNVYILHCFSYLRNRWT